MSVFRRGRDRFPAQAATVALTGFLLLLAASTLLSVLIGKGSDVFVSIVSNALFVPLGALLTLLYFNGGRDRILAYRYRRLAVHSPQELLPGAIGDSVRIERVNLVGEVIAEIINSPSGRVHLITGPSGSGKTTMLQSLIQASAARGFMPIVVQADLGADFANMESCAEAGFIAAADRAIRTSFDLTRSWRTIRNSGQILVFIDGLDDWRARVGTGTLDTLALVQESSRATPYRFIAAIRSGDENPSYTYPTYAVGRLQLGAEALDTVLPTAPLAVDSHSRDAWLTVIEATEADRSPLFMKLASDLIHYRETLESIPRGTPTLAQLALLDGWLHRKVRRYAAYHPESLEDLEDRIMMLAQVSFCLALEGRLEADMNEIPAILERHSVAAKASWRRINQCVQLGQNVDLLHSYSTYGENSRRLRFRHSTFQTYMAVLFLRHNAASYREPDLRGASEELVNALRSYISEAPGTATRTFRHAGINALRRGEGGGLAWFTVLSSAESLSSRHRQVILMHINKNFVTATDAEKIRIVELVASATTLGQTRYRLLWHWSTQGGYAIGISAVRALARGGSTSLREVGGEVSRLINANRGKWLYDPNTWVASGEVVTTLATAIPLWREHVEPVDRGTVERWNKSVLNLISAGQLGGVEISVVAGFEAAARESPSTDVWRDALGLLRTVRSHDAKLRLLRLFHLNTDAMESARKIIEAFSAYGQHPFVSFYATLLRSASASDLGTHWQGNEHAEPKAGVLLHPNVHQMLADRYLLSALEDQGGGSDEEVARRQQAWLSRRLPWCLSHSVDRKEIFSGCPSNCDFGLCPIDIDALVLRRASPASPVFLQHAAELTRSRRRPWSKAFYGAKSATFWARLESAMRVVAGNSRYEHWRQPFPTGRPGVR